MLATILSLLLAAAPEIERVLPPRGNALPAETRQSLTTQLGQLQKKLKANPLAGSADVEVYLKAVDYALRHDEFYAPADAAKATAALEQAARRWESLSAGKQPWRDATGLVVRGYRSAIDDSAHPYGLVIPKDLDRTRPVPLYVWLHGRGDKQTDLHFIHERERSVGQIAPNGAIVLHPFGRHCLGFKSAGEIDVLEAVEHVCQEYSIDRRRVVLIGFSMGGAGAWHLGAHYTDRWCVVSPGAGFAETAEYNKLTPDRFPPVYERQLWGCYDVPGYVRNLFNVPVIAYSGEKDKQIQAARVMEAAYQREGRTLPHLIGPNVEHKYEPETLKELLRQIAAKVEAGQPAAPRQVHLQTRTLRYGTQFWVSALGLIKHWDDSRIDAQQQDDQSLIVSTKNITRLSLAPPRKSRRVTIDGQVLTTEEDRDRWLLQRDGEKWSLAHEPSQASAQPDVAATARLRKQPRSQGPIDDAFLEPFLFVLPSGRATSPAVQAWVEQESSRAIERWRAICRGEPRVKRDVDVTPDDLRRYHVILWGDHQSNQLIKQILGRPGDDRLPFRWNAQRVAVRDQEHASSDHLLSLIYPNPLNPRRYIVINSGLTFREGHDRTNSQQNPKLPDWAIIDVKVPPSATAAGGIVAADFFDEQWR